MKIYIGENGHKLFECPGCGMTRDLAGQTVEIPDWEGIKTLE